MRDLHDSARLGGVATWLDKINGILLPFYIVGLVAVVAAATFKQGYPSGWLDTVPTTGPLPGWLTSYLIYMGVWVMMMYTFDYARLGKPRDARFHGTVTFGWVFYFFTFGVNGLVGIYILSSWGIAGSESGVVQAIINSLGFAGVLLILISQTRINTANYYLASSNLQVLADRLLGITSPRAVWVLVAGILAYLFMLTDVLSYLLKALAWQGVLVTAWVAIALVHIAIHWTDRRTPTRSTVGAGAVAPRLRNRHRRDGTNHVHGTCPACTDSHGDVGGEFVLAVVRPVGPNAAFAGGRSQDEQPEPANSRRSAACLIVVSVRRCRVRRPGCGG